MIMIDMPSKKCNIAPNGIDDQIDTLNARAEKLEFNIVFGTTGDFMNGTLIEVKLEESGEDEDRIKEFLSTVGYKYGEFIDGGATELYWNMDGSWTPVIVMWG